ncbi:MAG: dihydroneopterin aldolase [Anaerolineaceae bacterium]|nr:dihydroneopterin aldolase [Anaerolineaceae bacterium]
MDKILITGLVVNAVIGVNPPEREFPQELLLDVELGYPLHTAGVSDSIDDSISYSLVAKLVRQWAQESSFYTLEALAACIIQKIFEETPADMVRIKIEKANFVRKTAKVGIQIERYRGI